MARSAGGASPGNPLLRTPAEKLLARHVRHRVQGQVQRGAGTRGQLLALPEHGGGWGSQFTMRSAPVDQTRWLARAACGPALWRLACWERWVGTAENVVWNTCAIHELLENLPLQRPSCVECLAMEAIGPPCYRPSSASRGLTDYAQVDVPGSRTQPSTLERKRYRAHQIGEPGSRLRRELGGGSIWRGVLRSHNARYRGTSVIRNTCPVGPYSSPMPRDLW